MTITNTDILCVNRKLKDQSPDINQDTFIQEFALGCGGKILSWQEAREHDNTYVLWGARSIKQVKEAEANNRDYYYIDNGYFGNYPQKRFFRIIRNATHDTRPILDRPDDRLKMANIKTKPFTKGSRIIVAPPSPKSFTLWDIDQPKWIEDTVNELKRYTDRPITVRNKRTRKERLYHDTIQEDLADDCHCLVTYNSVAAVEALIEGKPVITLGPNAATHLATHKLSDVEDIKIPTEEERGAWLRHLAYSQFTHQEMINGTAWRILNGQ
jgi:hypothetical protein